MAAVAASDSRTCMVSSQTPIANAYVEGLVLRGGHCGGGTTGGVCYYHCFDRSPLSVNSFLPLLRQIAFERELPLLRQIASLIFLPLLRQIALERELVDLLLSICLLLRHGAAVRMKATTGRVKIVSSVGSQDATSVAYEDATSVKIVSSVG